MENREQWETRRQVPETDPVYQKERQEMRNAYSDNIFCGYGVSYYEGKMRGYEKMLANNKMLQEELDVIEDKDSRDAQNIAREMEDNAKYASRCFKEKGQSLRGPLERLHDDVFVLLNQDGYEDRKEYVLEELRRMFDVPEIQDELKKQFGDDLSELNPVNLSVKFADGSLSDEFAYAIAKCHAEHVRKQEKQLEEIVELTKTEFKIAVTEAVMNGLLPKTAIEALHRVDAVKVSLEDRFSAILSGKLGDNDVYGRVSVVNDRLQLHLISGLKKTLVHEFTHEISGKSITVSTKIEDNPNKIHHIVHKKTGISLSNPYGHSPNTWINEAITEWLALELSGYDGGDNEFAYKGSASYPHERKELDVLFELGLDRETVLNAYFENFVEDQSQGQKGKYFRELIQKINTLKGPFGFTQLENMSIMREIESQLDKHAIFARKGRAIRKEKLPSDAKIITVAVTIGADNQAKVAEEFMYLARPSMIGNKTITIEDQMKKVEDQIALLQKSYGNKVKFSFVDEE